MTGFAKQYAIGKTGETEIAQWVMARGWHVLPAYEVASGQYKGPVFYTSSGELLVTPDQLIFKDGEMHWLEAKHKSAFTHHRMTGDFVTGIDLRVYRDYQLVSELSGLKVLLMFLQQPGTAKDSPPGPSGLYGAWLSHLTRNEHHRANGPDGMVYWAVETLKRIADYPLNKTARMRLVEH